MNSAEAWNYAMGMIKIDGLEPTEDFKKYIEKEKLFRDLGTDTTTAIRMFLTQALTVNGFLQL